MGSNASRPVIYKDGSLPVEEWEGYVGYGESGGREDFYADFEVGVADFVVESYASLGESC